MKKNGFTLIELLAVIVILAIIALIATPIILGIINDARKEGQERSVELYASAVRNGIAAYQLREMKEVAAGSYTTETLPFDVEYDGEIECTSIILSEDGKVSLTGCKVNGGEKEYNYGIEKEETPTAAGTMDICNPLNVQVEGKYTAGDKYECDVDPSKEGYDQMFFVLTTVTDEEATSVNLIMDSNIRTGGEAVKEPNPIGEQKGLVFWISEEDYMRKDVGGNPEDWNISSNDPGNWNKGPITALDYLQNATSTWANVNTQTISTFTDDQGNSYDLPIEYTMKARLPYYSEISNVSNTTLYLLDYLRGDDDENIPLEGRNGVSDVYGYWTLSSSTNFDNGAWFVFFHAFADDGMITNNLLNSVKGVRPVINLSI